MKERKGAPQPEGKGEHLGYWHTQEGIKTLSDSKGLETYDFSNDSDSYSTETPYLTSARFSKSEIQEVARKLDDLEVGRYSNSSVESYIRGHSWGGYVSSPSGPVSNWNSGRSRGFKVDGINIKLGRGRNE